MKKVLHTPISAEDLKDIHVGDVIYLTGHITTCRDVAHRRLIELGRELPIDLDGGANFTSYVDGVETKGTFVFDMTAGTEGYSIGTLTLYDASVLLPVDGYEGEGAGILSKFDIIELTDDTMVLAAALDGQIFQDENWNSYATYWNFKKKQ